MSLFTLFGEKFWQRYVFTLCDANDLLTLLQCNQHLYKQKKYLYKLIYQKMWINMSAFHHIYPINLNTIHYKFYNNLRLINHNIVLRQCFLKHCFTSYDPTLKTIQYLYNKYLNIMSNEVISIILDFIIKIFDSKIMNRILLSYCINNKRYFLNDDKELNNLVYLFQ